MADRRIGISLDVRNDAIDRVKRSFDDVTSATKDMEGQIKQVDEAVTDLIRNGWGSTKTTAELREQLKVMDNMARLLERSARTSNNTSAQRQAQQYQGSIRGMSQDIQAFQGLNGGGTNAGLRGSLQTAGIGAGTWAASQYWGKYQAGYGAAKSMNPSLANFSKTMMPLSQQTEAGGYGFLNSTNAGLGFSYQDLLSGGSIVKGATGRTSGFADQMRGIQQFGRMNGFDMNQAAGYFANSYQSGVTGGSQAQMSWQQYAILVANTVQSANMQGREGQVVQAMQSMTQIAQQTNMNPNQKQIGMLYATAGQTGNQALINQFPDMFSKVNAGIQNPGWGAMGQAAMWQAIAPGMNYWDAQLLQSKGATGVGPNGKTNFQNSLMYSYNHFGGDTAQGAVMAGNLLNMPPAQAQTLMQTYIKNGKFQEASVDDIKKSLQNTDALNSGSMSPMDQVNKGFTDASNNMQQAGKDMLAAASQLQKILFGNATVDKIAGPAAGIATAVGTAALVKKVIGVGAPRVVGGGMDALTTGAGMGVADLAVPALAATGMIVAANAYDKKVRTPYYQSQGDTQTMTNRGPEWVNKNGKPDYSAGLFGWLGKVLGSGGSRDPNLPAPNVPKFAAGGYISHPTLVEAGESGPERIVPDNGRGGGSFDAQESARNVVATVLALRPYSTLLGSALGGSGSSAGSGTSVSASQAKSVAFDPVFTQQLQSGQFSLSNPLTSGNGGSGGSGGGGSVQPWSNGDTSKFVKQFYPYAIQAAQRLGVPQQNQSNVAEYMLAQWGWETGWGSPASQAMWQNNNLAGIKPWKGKGAGSDSTYAGYSNYGDFANGYADFLSQNPNYTKVVQGMRTGASPADLVKMIGQTPYAEDSSYGANLQKALGGVTGSMSSSVNVNISAKPITVNVKIDQNGNLVAPNSPSLIHYTRTATTNGQASHIPPAGTPTSGGGGARHLASAV